ncbi:MAG: hypothetical protein CM1200mP2_13730 [Planctomycetaceae bacterium]|nr:MAG: hypothetical protein CM1200mP2_13730 [Planctomycetaceae bacterium]
MPFSTYLPGYGFYYSLGGSSYFPEKNPGPKNRCAGLRGDDIPDRWPREHRADPGTGPKAWGYTYKGPDDTIPALWSEKTRRSTYR